MKINHRIRKEDYLTLVGDGVIGNSKIADGRLIPVLILDTTIKKDLESLVQMHEQLGGGDVTSVWGYHPFNHKVVVLLLYFNYPIELKLAISFNVLKHSSIIDGILISRAVYLQPGIPGDKISDNINAPKVVVEIPARTTFDKWDKILYKTISKKLKKQGIDKKVLKEETKKYISIRREVWGERIK